MTTTTRHIAVVLAAGSGRRTGLNTPKQFCPLAGHPLVAYSLTAFERHPDIAETAVVIHPDYVEEMQALARRYGWQKLRKILPGGQTRTDSSRAAIEAYRQEPDACLLLHDAARPLVDADVVSRLCRTLQDHPAVAVAVPSTDTLFCVSNGQIASVPDRSTLWRAQTPQAFRESLLLRAYDEAARRHDTAATDDCGMVMRYCPDTPIRLVEGSEAMLKVTYREDFMRAETWLTLHPELKP